MPGLGDYLKKIFQPSAPMAQSSDPMAGMGPMDRFAYLRQNSPETLMSLAGGLMNGDVGGAFAAAGQAMGQHRQEYQQRQDAERKQNLTRRWLMANRGLSNEEADMALSNPMILGSYLKGQTGEDVRYSMQPIYGTDAEGKTVLGTVGSDGSFKAIDTGGFNVAAGIDKVDLGDRWALYDKRTGQQIGTEEKNLRRAESDLLTAEQTVSEIESLIQHPGLGSIVGPVDQFRPSWTMGAEGRDALARFNQAKGRAFLQAYATLKGGGQITEIEGMKAEQAMARMDRALNEEEFKIALQDFRDAVKAGAAKLRARAGQTAPAAGSLKSKYGLE